MSYDPEPTYPLREGAVDVGYEALAKDGARDGVKVIAVDGASTVAWDRAAAALRSAFTPLVGEVQIVDMRRHALPWAEVERLTTDPALADDPAFARIPDSRPPRAARRAAGPERRRAAHPGRRAGGGARPA